jgi:hypothetical protein
MYTHMIPILIYVFDYVVDLDLNKLSHYPRCAPRCARGNIQCST